MSRIQTLWTRLDPADEPGLVWVRSVPSRRAAVLLGAFDPPTLAHVCVAQAASRATGRPAAFCLTRVLLDRPSEQLLEPVERLRLLDRIAAQEQFGLALANRGTYLEVARAAAAAGIDAVFVVGSDKLEQLRDPSFYSDGNRGVGATFAQVRFVVVPRAGALLDDLPEGSEIVALRDPSVASISGTEVRRRVRAGLPVEGLVPPVVASRLAGYTEPSEPR